MGKIEGGEGVGDRGTEDGSIDTGWYGGYTM